MRVLVTGADGFIAQNLCLSLAQRKDIEIIRFTRGQPASSLSALLDGTDFVFHLAGVNRPDDPQEFTTGNRDLTAALCEAVGALARASGRKIPIVFASSIQAELDNPYGKSKLAAELALREIATKQSIPVFIFRLPNVFGKWCKPNYNSVVATFCHNTARGLPIRINDPEASLTLVYIDDVVQHFMRFLDEPVASGKPDDFESVEPRYTITVGELSAQIESFRDGRKTLAIGHVGAGLTRALYATYISYLPTQAFVYSLESHSDPRGMFVEMIKTPDSGQVSYFTAHPGVTRGGHYHQSKTEKFLVIKGRARFRFRHMLTGERYELLTSGDRPQIVDTVPGWAHDITNVGDEEMLVLLWANEVFDRARPDTFTSAVQE